MNSPLVAHALLLGLRFYFIHPISLRMSQMTIGNAYTPHCTKYLLHYIRRVTSMAATKFVKSEFAGLDHLRCNLNFAILHAVIAFAMRLTIYT